MNAARDGRRRRRACAVTVGLALAILLAEVTANVAGRLALGADFVARAREEQARIVAGSSAPTEAPLDAVPSALRFYALHPYLGFVADPASTTGPVRDSLGGMVPTELGFFRRRRDYPARGEDPLRVAVLGGSVAFLLSLKADHILERLLRASSAARGRDVIVESFALPGHKQPQQLFALAYLLLLGKRFDVVVNLDGFNELALPLAENLPQGTAAIYPRSWSLLATRAPSPALIEEAARLSALRERRRVLAELFALPVLRASASGALAWRLLDGRMQTRIVDDGRLQARIADDAAAAGAGAARAVEPAAAASAVGANADASADDLPALVDVWRRSSLLMHQLCAANDITYLHVLQPNQYLPGAKPMSADERRVAYREDHPYRRAVESGYPLLLAAGGTLRDAGVRFVDLSGIFADIAEPLYVDDCCHVSQRGNEILAERLAGEVAHAIGG